MRKILVVVGTYSEAILMAPLVHRLRTEPARQTIVCLAAQHRQMLDQVLDMFGIRADEDFNPMEQWPNAPVSQGIDHVIEKHRPDRVLVHGDTAASMDSSHLHTPAGGGETGLRSYELQYAGPGGTSGHGIDLVSTTHFVCSEVSRTKLLKEGIAAESIYLTDSTAVDALLMVVERIRHDDALKAKLAAAFPFIDPHRRLILVIGHRRENRSGGLESVCRALRRLATRPDVHVAYPVPPNPRARGVVEQLFANHPGITLIEPPDYTHSVYLMQAAYLILADSGNTPKEALSMGKPVLVMRDVAERPGVIDAGTIRLVGTDAERIQRECTTFLDDRSYYRAFSTHRNPYGDGQASRRIVEILLR
jgi:UDP-N-acetylglucosamine 2-epimerase (non-hydrolysing)